MLQKRKVLLVEDDPKSAKLVRGLLAQAGYETVLLDNAETCLYKAKDYLPDLILMDFQLPGMTGETAIRLLRTDPVTAVIPVIIVTASAITAERERIISALNVKVLMKPIDTRNFIREVEEVLHAG
jgi:CheY-like chemotaxis protein